MTTYRLWYSASASTYIDVEADDPDEAIDKADEVGLPGLCAHCSGWRTPGIDLSDWEPGEDGRGNVLEPEAIRP